MTAGMEYGDAAGWERSQTADESFEIQPMGFRVVIWIGAHLESGRFKERAVILPAWRADVETGIRQEPLAEIRADLQPARSTQSLNGDCPAGGDHFGIRAEHQILH